MTMTMNLIVENFLVLIWLLNFFDFDGDSCG